VEAENPVFHQKICQTKSSASRSTATANAVPAELSAMIDSKSGLFFGLFLRKNGVRADKNNTCFRVFTYSWDLFLSKPLCLKDKRRADPFQKNRAENLP
jgi:hypothetical protein